MNADLVLDIVEQVLLSRQLSPIEKVILCQSWQGKGYGEMAKDSGYGSNYFKEVGSQLWHDLSEAIGQRVTKKNLHLVLARYQQNEGEPKQETQHSFVQTQPENKAANSVEDNTFYTEKSFVDTRTEIEYPGGPVPLNSSLYINRLRIEEMAYKEITKPGCLIRIKAPRKMGKSSLLNRMIACAQNYNYRIAYIDFQETDETLFTSLDKFLRWFCANVSRQLNLNNKLDDYWDEDMGSKVSCKIYFEEYLLEQINAPIFLALNEVNRLFEHLQIANDFLSMLRFWHEVGRTVEIWQNLRLIIVHSTEIHIPLKINQSPFNVGLSIKLPQFTLEEVQDLASRYGLNWIDSRSSQQLMAMVGGHPYLINLAFYHLHREEMTLQQLLETSPTAAGIYSNHLRNHLAMVREQPELASALLQVVTANESVQLDALAAFKLESMGLIQLDGNQAKPSCQLYRLYFSQQLVEKHLDASMQQSTLEKQQVKLSNKVEQQVQSVSRTYIKQYLETSWQQWRQELLPLSLIICEIDYFKWYNDIHGYVAGDAALQQITSAISQCIQQKQSSLVRYGGTKFAAILPYVNAKEVVKVGENMRDKVKALGIPYNLPGIDGLPSEVLSISVGVVSVTPTTENSPDLLINAAEEALFQAKRQGRDRVHVSSTLNERVSLTQQVVHFPRYT
ncbi:diguanylate cyclase [Scytonema sp. UIC 10036]|uniref:AAA-like domain-containing protein n=1 Tax=Scytonema sp. UIC 10036 TaxID=2304196 RepID=UPI0012DAC43C|nr:AAA-like domain-containing protein [Scytonema sp. UIC 10036]MUH00903.1 diguanylate cyclase [Scytonema sp. UIC 10036]